MGTINTTYSQPLQRNMFARQREQTDKTYKKVLREERIRIIKSASRRNPKLLAQAIVRSKQALQEHAEWRINQEIMRSCSNSQGNSPPSRHRANQSNVTIDLSQREKQLSPSGHSTQLRGSQQKFFDRSQNRSAAASVQSNPK